MNRIRVAVVGLNFGGWMIEHEMLSGDGQNTIEIVAVCDADERKTGEWSGKLGVPGYTDVRQALADERAEAVALFTGPVGRGALIERIVAAGKHVMTTKPFETDAACARRALDRARQCGRAVHLNCPTPEPRSDLLQVSRWIDRYDLGRPIAFRAETTCSYRETADGSWYDDPELCPAAPIFRLGIYLIHDCIRFFGEAESVTVQQSRMFTGRPTPDNAQLGILFRNGAIGNVFASFCIDDRQYYKAAFTMNFERGTICRNRGIRAHGTGSRPNELELVAVRNGLQVTDSFVAQSPEHYPWDAFCRAVRTGRTNEPAYDDEIVSGIRLIEMMKQHK